MGAYTIHGLTGLVGCEPTCPKCGHANAMLHVSFHRAIKRGVKDNGGEYADNPANHCYECRDCGYFHEGVKEKVCECAGCASVAVLCQVRDTASKSAVHPRIYLCAEHRTAMLDDGFVVTELK